MKKILIVTIFLLITSILFAKLDAPTPTPNTFQDIKTVKIPVKVEVKSINGTYQPYISDNLYKYIVGVVYIYNEDKTYAIAILDVPETNETNVNSILQSTDSKILDNEISSLENEFPGLITNYGIDEE